MDALRRRTMLDRLGLALDGDEESIAWFLAFELAAFLNLDQPLGPTRDRFAILANVASAYERAGLIVTDIYFDEDEPWRIHVVHDGWRLLKPRRRQLPLPPV